MSKIMLVEDDNNLREIYGARLEAEGYEIVSAKDGEEALALAVQEKPDLIISDVMMPRISGFDMLDILRNAPETKETKVIMMTALSQAEDKSRADKLGADRYLVKSQVTLEDVANVVHEVLEGTSTEGSATPVATEAPAPVSQPTPATAPAETVDAIANPVVEVHDEPDPSQVQAPPAEEPAAPTRQPFEFKEPVAATPQPAPVPVPQPPTAASPEVIQQQPTVTPTPAPTTTVPIQDDNALPPIVQPAAAQPIKVELPQTIPVQPAPATNPATPAPQTPVAAEPDEADSTTFVGPNLAEALASEEAGSSEPVQQTTNSAAPAPSLPAVSNGAPAPTIITPQQPQSVPPAPEPEPVVTTNNNVAGMRVIEPIGDMTTGPNINELLENEERKAAVANPTANTVITPEPPQQQPPANDKFNNIAL